MIVHVRLFAGARDSIGADSVGLELDPNSTIRALRDRLIHDYPALKALLTTGRFAVNQQFVDMDFVLDVDLQPMEIAFIPPVSGG